MHLNNIHKPEQFCHQEEYSTCLELLCQQFKTDICGRCVFIEVTRGEALQCL